MNFLAGFIPFLIYSTSAFDSASVDALNKTVGAQTLYMFSLYLSNVQPIPARFKIVLKLPPELLLLGSVGSLPNRCLVIDAPSIEITTNYNASNPSINQTDSDLDGQCGITNQNEITLITPKPIDFVVSFQIGLIVNPNISFTNSNLGPVLFYGYYENNATYSYNFTYNFNTPYFKPSLITVNLTQGSFYVGGWSTYGFSLQTLKSIPAGGNLILSFSQDSGILSSGMTAVGKIGSSASQTLTVSVSGQVLTISGLFNTLTPTNLIQFDVSQIKNPRFVGSTSGVFYSSTSMNELIETGSFTIITNYPCAMTLTGFVPTNRFVLSSTSIALYFSNDIYDSSNTNNPYYFSIVFPPTYKVQSSTICINAGGISSSPLLKCTVSNNQITSNQVTQIDKIVAIRLTSLVNPPNNLTTSYIKLYLYTTDNVLICMNETLVNFTATPNSLNLVQKTRNSQYIADPGPFTLNFTTSTQVPAGGFIKLMIPLDQFVETTGISCFSSVSNSNICSKSNTPLDPLTVELTMTEWCSSIDSLCLNCCSAGTTFSLTLSGIRNPMYNNNTVSSQIRAYTYSQNLTGVIDMFTAGGQFLPALVARSITGSISRTGDTVQLPAVLSFTFTTSTDYLGGAYLVLTLPTSLIYLKGSLTCSNSGTQLVCSASLNSDNSVKTLTIQICPLFCSAGSLFVIQVSGLVNPLTTASINGVYAFSAYYSGYTIEFGSLTSTINSFQPNIISNFQVTRGTNVVSASTFVYFLFTTASKVPAGGHILLTFPANLLISASNVQVLRGSRVLQYTGNLTSMTVIDYCDTDCSAGASINLTFTGLKNPDSVISILGLVQVTTAYVSTIDSGQVEISTILAPLEHGSIFDPEIHPVDPTVSVNTQYRVIFTTEHSIPVGSSFDILFPSGPAFNNVLCSAYLTVSNPITCVTTPNMISIRNAFAVNLKGSYMIGVLISNISNPGSPITYSGYQITLRDSNGFIIDQSSLLQVTYFQPAVSCSCSKCSGTVCFDCLIPSSFPFLESYSCVSQCSAGYFLTITQPYTCIKCHFTCATCSSQQANSCTSCAYGLYKSDGYCVAICPVGTTAISGVCYNNLPCSSPCSTCSNTPTYCLSCVTGYKYTQGTGLCQSSCSNGLYWNGTACINCYYKCSACSSYLNCSGCLSYYYEQVISNGQCVSACPIGVSVLKGNQCINCDLTCATCSDITNSTCLTCSGNRYFYQGTCVLVCPPAYYRSSGNLCIAACPNGYYITLDLLDCLSCSASCLTCSSAAVCLTCPNNTFLYSGQCLANCPNGYLKNNQGVCMSNSTCNTGLFISADWCLPCPNQCSVCSSNYTCSVCQSGSFLFNSTCSQSCPASYVKMDGYCRDLKYCTGKLYIDGDTCKNCSSTCNTCSSLTTCTSCSGNLYLSFGSCVSSCPNKYYEYSNNTCLSNCPNGTFPTNSSCQSCMAGCSICQNNSSCFTCQPSYYLTYTGECVLTCPSGYYNSSKGTCELICTDLDCLSCSKSNVSVCLNCKSPSLLYNGLCVNYCPSGYFSDISKCTACSVNCLNCDSLSSCNTCKSSTLLYKGSCVSSCPDSTYKSSAVCSACSANCSKCLSSSQCLLCGSESVLWAGYCTASCPSGYTANSGVCSYICPGSCTGCNGEMCLGCNSGYLLNGKCLNSCPDGFYANNNTCVQCESNCLTCSAGGTCLKCSNLTFLYQKTCQSICPSNTTAINGSCIDLACPSHCISCITTGCLSCEVGFGLLNSSCETCPLKTYSKNSTCISCKGNCETCSDETTCLSCTSGYLYQSQCVLVCPKGYKGENKTCTVDKNTQKQSGQSFLVYPLAAEFFFISILLVVGLFVHKDSYLVFPSTLALFSVLLFSCKVFLITALWQSSHAAAGILVPITSALIIGSSSISLIFIYMHLDPLSFQNASLEYYKSVHPKTFALLKTLTVLCGVQFIRLIYCGIFGLPSTTESKSLSLSSRFRRPLEKLSQLNVFIVSVPLLVVCLACLGLFSFHSDVWQVSLFTGVASVILEGCFLISYYRNWAIN